MEPKALQDRPEVFEHLSFVWSAWWELHTDRPMGMSVGPIPFTAISAFADRYGVAELDAFDTFRELIRAMDGEYLKWVPS